MIRYVGLRLATAIPTLLLVIAASFFLLRAAPGGPFDTDRALPADVEANLNARYGLDLPMHEQFFKYVGGLFRGDFGPSYRYKDVQVSEIIADQLPISLTIGFFCVLVHGRVWDHAGCNRRAQSKLADGLSHFRRHRDRCRCA